MRCQFEYRRYRLPFRTPVRTAHGLWSVREGVFVRLTLQADEGAPRSGIGEAAPVPGFGTESVDAIVRECASIGGTADAHRLDAVPGNLSSLRHAIHAARLAIESGPDPDGPAFLPVAALLPAGREALGVLPEKSDGGFRIFKWKVGVGDVADELVLMDDLCARLPSGGLLRLDANGAWDRRKAERWLSRCADRPVEFVEQPVGGMATDDSHDRERDLLMGLAEDYPTPLALDESLVADGDVEKWIRAGWRGVFVVKPSLIGDLETAMAQLHRAGADVVFSSALETVVGVRSALGAAFSWSGKRRALGFGVGPLFVDARFDGLGCAPFIRCEDVTRMDLEAAWNALN